MIIKCIIDNIIHATSEIVKMIINCGKYILIGLLILLSILFLCSVFDFINIGWKEIGIAVMIIVGGFFLFEAGWFVWNMFKGIYEFIKMIVIRIAGFLGIIKINR